MQTIFVDGLNIYPPNEKAPDFVKGSLVVTDVQKLTDFINKYQDDKGQVRIDINVAKSGKLYLKLNPYGNSRLQALLADADHVNGKDDGEAPKDGHYAQRMRERVAQSEPTDELEDIPF